MSSARYASHVITLTVSALTCPSAQLEYNYQRLEWLGDSVWRVVCAFRGSSKALVRSRYNHLMSNDNMGHQVSVHCPWIHESSVTSGVPNLKAPQTCRSRLRNFHILADITEALLAVAFLAFGVKGATEAAEKLGLFESDSEEGTDVDLDWFKNNVVKPAISRLHASLAIMDKDVPVGVLNEFRRIELKKINFSEEEIPDSFDKFSFS